MHDRTRMVLAIVTISLSLGVRPGFTAGDGGLAAQYPGDVGIESHPDVVFVERFDDSLANIVSRWDDVRNGANMTLDADVPDGSSGSHSLAIAGLSGGGHLYKLLSSAGYTDTLHLRYYIKYPTSGNYSHTGVWMGGHNPPLPWPNPQAGTKPQGNDRFIASGEDIRNEDHFDYYNYWMGMHADPSGNYWGNDLLNDRTAKAAKGVWMCVEQMVKLNNPVTALNGEHALWLDGQQISHVGQGFPQGYWVWDSFIQDPSVSTTFEGFQWRNDPALKLNWIWLQNFTPNDPSVTLKFDHVVVAKSYIGCLASELTADTMRPAPPRDLTVR